MALMCRGIYIVGAKRTPFCKYGGLLRDFQASHLYAEAAKDAIRSADLDPKLVNSTIIGNAFYLSQCDGGKTPRYCGLYSGVPIDRPALGVSKACGTGLQAIMIAALELQTGQASITLTGGTELMSSLPLMVRGVRYGTTLSSTYQLEDTTMALNYDSTIGLTLAETAENVAKQYNLSMEEINEFSRKSRDKFKLAQDTKAFQEELTAVTAKLKKREVLVDRDYIEDRIEVAEGNVITSGNSSSHADGAAALILADEVAVKQHRLQPVARVAAWAAVGVGPRDAGVGAASAIARLLEVASLQIQDVDLFEINETFASQTLAIAKVLGIDQHKLNPHGGALSLGNPVAATGARMAVHMTHLLRDNEARRGVVASNCAGGQGVAILLETV